MSRNTKLQSDCSSLRMGSNGRGDSEKDLLLAKNAMLQERVGDLRALLLKGYSESREELDRERARSEELASRVAALELELSAYRQGAATGS